MLKMMRRWRWLEVDDLIRSAYAGGAMLRVEHGDVIERRLPVSSDYRAIETLYER